MPRKKTWTEKLATGFPKVEPVDKSFAGLKLGQMMLVATPRIVRDYIAAIPRGQARSIVQMRDDLARAHKAEVTCPMTTGIFVRIASEAALEDLSSGKTLDEITPFWRIVDSRSPTAKKLSCGPDFIAARRAAEGLD
ncbi:hypothetical protein GR304_01740 [Microvirga sp. SYSU G3D207]|uniref:Uncharacterized protein n=2 Tax=Microvirga arsenatis TaxID=2692265 RepID=A0ABW9YT42_9HYPH|nr:hypothetical protein [Microvirga arsenatis]NBJ09627.1 hypothetical protein [Microvirga arsenatis]NBJ23514.1 hypothetical protein [Microvirga arsenatis]